MLARALCDDAPIRILLVGPTDEHTAGLREGDDAALRTVPALRASTLGRYGDVPGASRSGERALTERGPARAAAPHLDATGVERTERSRDAERSTAAIARRPFAWRLRCAAASDAASRVDLLRSADVAAVQRDAAVSPQLAAAFGFSAAIARSAWR